MAYGPYGAGWEPVAVGRQFPEINDFGVNQVNDVDLVTGDSMELHQLRNKVQEGYRQLFSRHQFDIAVTLRFEHASYSNREVLSHVQEFVRELAKHSKDQVAGYSVVNTLGHPHAHLLLLGKNRSLAGVNTAVAESLWNYGSALSRGVYSGGAASYAALNITPNAPDCSAVYFHNKRLLKRTQKIA